MNRLYGVLKQKSRGCRDRDVRIKLELFMLALKLGNVSEACARRGFSRRFYYRWWNRFRKSHYNLRSLEEYSRRPHRSPKRIAAQLEKRIFWYHRRQYGARMIEAMLGREGIKLSRSTICHVLRKRRQRPLTRKARLKTHRKRYELLIPGQRLQIDVKYAPELIENRRAYVFVAVDECTRWRFARAYLNLSPSSTVDFLRRLKDDCPFPIHTIQTDHGFEFTNRLNPFAQHVTHEMDAWCVRNRIHHRLIPVGVKELNGKVERSHRIDEQYFYWRAPRLNLALFQQALKDWMEYYNTQRLHGGLGYITPSEKLMERQNALQNTPLPALPEELEKIRINFINNTPKYFNKIDRQILTLENQLKKLIKAA